MSVVSDFYLKSISSACVCAGVYERMKVDQRKFGKSSWTAAVERMERLRYSVAKETLQLQRAREICLDQRKHKLREQVWQKANSRTQTQSPVDFFLSGPLRCRVCVAVRMRWPS